MPTDANVPISLRDLIAGNLRRLRQAAGRAGEDLVPTARAHGLDWTANWLTSVERGTRALTAEQLLALPVVLSAALGIRVSLADLLVGEAPVALSPAGEPVSATVPAGYLLGIVTGAPVRRTFTPTPRLPEGDTAAAASLATQRMRDIREAGLGDVDMRALTRAEQGAGTVETKLAKRLAVPPIAVIAAAASLWGRSASDEQAFLVSEGMSAAAAGKKITADVQQRLRDARYAVLEARLAAQPPVTPPGPAEQDG